MERVPVRLGAFALALVAVFGLAFGVGRVTGDDGDAGRADDEMVEMDDGEMAEMEGEG